MSDLRTVREHLASVSIGANEVHRRMKSDGNPVADDLVQTFAHLHGAIEALTQVVESALRQR